MLPLRPLHAVFLLGLTLVAGSVQGRVEHLLPRPKRVVLRDDAAPFVLGRSVSLRGDTANVVLRAFVDKYLSVDSLAPGGAVVVVEMVGSDEGEGYEGSLRALGVKGVEECCLWGYPCEAYELSIGGDSIRIRAKTEVGVCRAAQTLFQLAEGERERQELEPCLIVDWPSFPLRGLMHDVGRCFIPLEELRHEIDLLSLFKVNTLHLHLTDDIGWRMEVRRYPQLTAATDVGDVGQRQYYTQEELSGLEHYARKRGVTIIPEIDMPGHSMAFERAMGHSMQSPQGREELRHILSELAETFPLAPYLHIGADEQAIVDSTFLPSMAEAVRLSGKRVVVWNPVRGVRLRAGSFADMTQMWSTAGKAVEGIPNIDCRYNYINHFDTFADIVGIYLSNIYGVWEGTPEVAGTITAVWNDRQPASVLDIIRQNNIYAAVLASAERAWVGGGYGYIEQRGVVMPPDTSAAFAEFCDWERRFLFHKAHTLRGEPVPYVRQTNVHWLVTDAFPNGGDPMAILPPDTLGPQSTYTYEGRCYGTHPASGAGIYLRHTWGGIVPALMASPELGTTSYAWTYVYSPCEQTVGALVEFQNYSRSEADPAPSQGQWDRKGSRLWLNDEELLPPLWLGDAEQGSRLLPLLNENCSSRPPLRVHLRQGWNKVFIKLPYVDAQGIRLNKWMFTFVLVSLDGSAAMPDVVYSPVPRPIGL